jgi:dephospho-CoA kinase
MIKIGMVGDIGSGKSFVAKQFGYPIFNADTEVAKIYKTEKSCFLKLKKKLPKYINSYPIKKNELGRAILKNKNNLKKIVNIVHPLVRKRMNNFLKKNYKSKMVVLDIPLLIENKMYDKNFVLIFIKAKKSHINKKLKERSNYNKVLIKNLRKLQTSIKIKKKLSHYVIKNNFKLSNIKKNVTFVKKQILNDRNRT